VHVITRRRIGITGPDQGGSPAWLATGLAVRLAGGRPIRITRGRGLPDGALDGLILGGGADVAPHRYGVEPDPDDEAPVVRDELRGETARGKLRSLAGYVLSPAVYLFRRILSVKLGGLDPARDELELALLAQAEEDGAPVLGICRGAQIMNVARGGTLHRELSSFYAESPNPWTVFPRKSITVDAGSSLARALGTTRCRVNSLHRQAVDDLGGPLTACAREDNGLVQAVEAPGPRFYVGVQWHPEYLPQRPEQRRLFEAFIAEARAHARHHRSSPVGRRALRAAHELVSDLAVAEEHRRSADEPGRA